MRRWVFAIAAVAVVLFGAGIAVVSLIKIDKDPVCTYARGIKLNCPTLVADPVTLRPGGIVKQVPDTAGEGLFKIDLPISYLDNASCLFPGVNIAPWSPRDEQPFELQAFNYDFNVVSRLGGKVPLPAVQGVEIDADAAVSRVSRISLSFGAARTRLLDENALINRIESCEIRPQCVERIKQNQYRVVNRVLEVEGMSFAFEDSSGARIPLGVLLENRTIRAVSSSFDLSQKNATSLNSNSKMVIALSTIDPEALANAKACTLPVVYSFEGSSRARVGGDGRPGYIAPQDFVFADLGGVAKAQGQGSENNRGDIERTVSSALANASIAKVDSQSIRLRNTVRIQGGHYGVKEQGPLGTGIASRQDTSANAEGGIDGRINMLVRTGASKLKVSWQNFAMPGTSPGIQRTDLEIVGPGGIIDKIPDVGGSGEKLVALPGEGYYSVIVRNVARAEGSGWSAQATNSLDGIVRAEVQAE